MKKLFLVFAFLFIGQIAIGQSLHRIYPIAIINATDTALYLQKSFGNFDTLYTDRANITFAEASSLLTQWKAEAENNETKWRNLYIRDSLYADSVQALIDLYIP